MGKNNTKYIIITVANTNQEVIKPNAKPLPAKDASYIAAPAQASRKAQPMREADGL